MRAAFVAFVVAALASSGILASSAFNASTRSGATVTFSVVTEAQAYLGLAPAPDGLHQCFVSHDGASGQLVVSFGSASSCPNAGTGSGVNEGSGSRYNRYAFHDAVRVKNQGQKTVWVWVNATTASAAPNLLEVAKRASPGTMTEAHYYTSSAAGLQLASTESLFVGLRVNATLSAGDTFSGSVLVEAHP